MYLLDTNILLELMLNQARADEVEEFLRRIPLRLLFISEFSMYSLGIRLFGSGRHTVFDTVTNDLLKNGRIAVLKLEIDDLPDMTEAAQKFRLGFDDAYQYAVARKHDLLLVSFDRDLDRSDRGRLTPAQALADYRQRHPPPATP